MTLIACGVVLGVVGPGTWSIDEAVGTFQPVLGSLGLWIVLVAGFGSAALTLCWRPSRGDGGSDDDRERDAVQ